MAGIDNLKTPSTDEARERGSKGGIASGKARREKKAMKDTLMYLLELPLNTGDSVDLEEIQSVAELNGKNITVQEAIILAQIKKAVKGDRGAAEFIRDLSGNKPKDELQVSGEVNNPFAGLTTEELKKLVNSE